MTQVFDYICSSESYSCMKISLTTFILIYLFCSAAIAQSIPNGSFEEWRNGDPVGWHTSNVGPYIAVSRTAIHSDGNWAAHGEYLTAGIDPELVLSPRLHLTTRPQALNGAMATQLTDSSEVNVYVEFTERTGSACAWGRTTITSSSTDLRSFSIPIHYANDSVQPDSVSILIWMRVAKEGSSYTVDALSFGDYTADVPCKIAASDLRVFDRDSHKEISFELEANSFVTLNILDMEGRIVNALFSGVTSGGTYDSDTSRFPSGVYLCRLLSEEGVLTRKILVVH
jgi:hypothetical protein